MRTFLLSAFILFQFSSFTNAAFESPKLKTELLNHSSKNVQLAFRLACIVYEKDSDGDVWNTNCQKYDAEHGGLDSSQEKLKDAVVIKPKSDGDNNYDVPSLMVYSSIRGKPSYEFVVYALDNNGKILSYAYVENQKIADIAKILSSVTFYSVEEQSTVFSIQDANNLSVEEFMRFFPEKTIRFSSFSASKEGKSLSYGYSSMVDASRIIKTLPFSILEAGALPEDYRYLVKVKLTLPTDHILKTTVEASTSLGILGNPIFKTNIELEDYFFNGRYRFDAFSSYKNDKNETLFYKFVGEVTFSCNSNRVLSMKGEMADDNGNKYPLIGSGRCYAGKIEINFVAPIYNGKEIVKTPVKITQGLGYASYNKTYFQMKAVSPQSNEHDISFKINGREYKKFPNFPNACIDREQAMKLAENIEFKDDFDSGLSFKLPHDSIENGTYVYANQPPVDWKEFATRESFAAYVNKMAGKEVLKNPREEMYTFYDIFAMMGCRFESIVILHCDKTFETYTRRLDCI